MPVGCRCLRAALVQVPDARSEVRMLRDAASGVPPEDGGQVDLSGTIRSAGPLRAPFSGEDREVDRSAARPAFEAFAAQTTFIRPGSRTGTRGQA